MPIKVLLSCTNADEKLVRYSKELFEKKLDDTDEETYEMCCNELGLDPNKHYHVGKGFGENNRLLVTGDEGYYMIFDKPLNGTVCFSCNIRKAEEIRGKKFLPLSPYVEWETDSLDEYKLLKRACLNHKQMSDYQPKHALYLTNVKEIKPFQITELWKYKAHPFGPYHLSRAPQNMCWAWRWNDKGLERVLVLSLRPRHLCNIANGLKDIETRRQVVNEIKEMEE